MTLVEQPCIFSGGPSCVEGPPTAGLLCRHGRDCPRFQFCSGGRPPVGGPPSARDCPPCKGTETPRARGLLAAAAIRTRKPLQP